MAQHLLRIGVGFYCTGFVTVTVMFVLYCLLCVEHEVYLSQETTDYADRVQRNYVPYSVHLPTRIIYKSAAPKIVKTDDGVIVYRNTVEEFILDLPWVKQLRRILENVNTAQKNLQVNFVVSDANSIELLLNWLIAALARLREPLHNVIVLGLDSHLCELLNYREISCVHADPASFIQPNEKLVNFLPVFSAPQTRLLAVRLVNYWGYSVASYDTDAVLLRNPQPLYDAHRGANIVAGAGGHWPTWAIEEWGFSVCLGTIMIRSGAATEMLWKDVSVSWGDWGSEQDQFNRALRYNVVWNTTTPGNSPTQFCQQKYGWKGISKKEPRFSLVILPNSRICRGKCCYGGKMSQVYVAHTSGGRIGNVAGKSEEMRTKGVWFLRENWQEVTEKSIATGVHWLELLATH